MATSAVNKNDSTASSSSVERRCANESCAKPLTIDIATLMRSTTLSGVNSLYCSAPCAKISNTWEGRDLAIRLVSEGCASSDPRRREGMQVGIPILRWLYSNVNKNDFTVSSSSVERRCSNESCAKPLTIDIATLTHPTILSGVNSLYCSAPCAKISNTRERRDFVIRLVSEGCASSDPHIREGMQVGIPILRWLYSKDEEKR